MKSIINIISLFLTIVFLTSCENKELTIVKSEIPTMKINTENKAPIDSKDNYVNGNMEVFEYNGDNDELVSSGKLQIKGRGNTTWTMPKKPYRVKLDEKLGLFDLPKSKHWTLLANYTDKSMLRNEIAFEMGRMSVLEWTPRTHFLNLILNGKLQGVYQLTEQIRIDKDRVNVTDDGYIIEVDSEDKVSRDDITFKTERLLFTIKDPDVETNDNRYNWIKNHINMIENILYSDNFNDSETGYKTYIDIESFVDWYLINEIAKNPDACFYSSCYMNITPGGKLKMGPLWDFDIAFGSDYFLYYDVSPNDFWVKPSAWINRMFLDPEFVDLVKTRFQYFKSKKSDIIHSLNQNAKYLKYAAVNNEVIWHTLLAGENVDAIISRYEDEVRFVENWIIERFDWLDKAFGEL